jgi:pilus assembly protein CpaC
MDKTELVVIVTPRLVQPLQPDYTLPTDAFIRPGRGEFFLQGRLEGRPPAEEDVSNVGDMDVETSDQQSDSEISGFQMR